MHGTRQHNLQRVALRSRTWESRAAEPWTRIRRCVRATTVAAGERRGGTKGQTWTRGQPARARGVGAHVLCRPSKSGRSGTCGTEVRLYAVGRHLPALSPDALAALVRWQVGRSRQQAAARPGTWYQGWCQHFHMYRPRNLAGPGRSLPGKVYLVTEAATTKPREPRKNSADRSCRRHHGDAGGTANAAGFAGCAARGGACAR